MRKTVIFLSLVAIFTFGTQNAFSQSFFRAGGSVGGMLYSGDLKGKLQPGGGLLTQIHFHPNFSTRLQYNYGRIASTLGDSTKYGLNFRSNLSEFSAQLVFEFFGYDAAHRHVTYNYWYGYRSYITPYVYAGISLFHFNPEANFNGDWVTLQPIGTEGQYLSSGTNPKPYSLYQIAIPFGFGIRTRISDRIDISVDVGFRKTFTDYLDDVSTNFPDPTQLEYEKGDYNVQVAFQDLYDKIEYGDEYKSIARGNSTKKDWYTYISIQATYIFDRWLNGTLPWK